MFLFTKSHSIWIGDIPTQHRLLKRDNHIVTTNICRRYRQHNLSLLNWVTTVNIRSFKHTGFKMNYDKEQVTSTILIMLQEYSQKDIIPLEILQCFIHKWLMLTENEVNQMSSSLSLKIPHLNELVCLFCQSIHNKCVYGGLFDTTIIWYNTMIINELPPNCPFPMPYPLDLENPKMKDDPLFYSHFICSLPSRPLVCLSHLYLHYWHEWTHSDLFEWPLVFPNYVLIWTSCFAHLPNNTKPCGLTQIQRMFTN